MGRKWREQGGKTLKVPARERGVRNWAGESSSG